MNKKKLLLSTALLIAALITITPINLLAQTNNDLMITMDMSNLFVIPTQQMIDESFEINVTLNGGAVNFDPPAKFFYGAAVAPIEAIFSALGAPLEFDCRGVAFLNPERGGYIRICTRDKTIFIGGIRGFGGHFTSLYVNGVFYIPIQLAAPQMGFGWYFDEETNTANIFSRPPARHSPISAGAAHSLAITSDEVLWAWGNNRQRPIGERYNKAPYQSRPDNG